MKDIPSMSLGEIQGRAPKMASPLIPATSRGLHLGTLRGRRQYPHVTENNFSRSIKMVCRYLPPGFDRPIAIRVRCRHFNGGRPRC